MKAQQLRTNEAKQDKSVIGIALITAACVAGDSMLYIVLPLFWQEFGLTAVWQIGVLLSINRFIRLPLNPIIGFIYRKIPLRTGILLAIALTFSATLAYGFAHSFALLVCARALWGIAWSLLRLGGYFTVLTTSTAHNRGYLMGRYNGLWGLGGLVGMALGGIFIHIVSIQVLTTSLACLTLLSVLLLKLIPKHKVQDEAAPKQASHVRSNQASSKSLQPWWKQPRVLFVLSSGLMIGLVLMGIFLTTLTLLIDEQIPTLVVFGVILSSTALSGLLQASRWAWDPFLAPWIGRKSDGQMGRKNMLVLALSLGSICIFLLTLHLPAGMFILCVLAFQVTSTMIMTLSDSAVSDVASKSSKVGVMTSYTVAVDVGAAVGPLLAYLLLDLASLQILYWITAALLGLMAFSWSTFKEGQKEKAEPSIS